METNATNTPASKKQDAVPEKPANVFKFKNEDVEKKYTAVFGRDKTVHVIGKYSGPLSGITLEAADKMFADKDNQLATK